MLNLIIIKVSKLNRQPCSAKIRIDRKSQPNVRLVEVPFVSNRFEQKPFTIGKFITFNVHTLVFVYIIIIVICA